MGLMIGWMIVTILIILALVEVGRYQRAQRLPDEFPYPRRRLVRRIATSLIFSAIMALVMYWPAKAVPQVTLMLLAVLLVGVLVGFALLWKDLRETSQAAIDHASMLTRQTSESLKTIFEKTIEEKGPEKTDPQ